jgi:hypothetical protein
VEAAWDRLQRPGHTAGGSGHSADPIDDEAFVDFITQEWTGGVAKQVLRTPRPRRLLVGGSLCTTDTI